LITISATTRNRCGTAVLSHQRIGRLKKEVHSLWQMGCFSDVIEGVNGSSAGWEWAYFAEGLCTAQAAGEPRQ
jgi:hypothetical protein